MKRRTFIAGLGSAAAWPAVARAQQGAPPTIGFLNAGTPETRRELVAATHRGLAETGYFEGRNLTVEYRWSEDRNDRFPALAADLVRRQVAVILAPNTAAALAAKAATQAIPIVFGVGADPIEIDLVASLSRPGGNLTGIFNLTSVVVAKRLELLREFVRAARTLAYLYNATNPALADSEMREVQIAARALAVKLLILQASNENDLNTAFAMLDDQKASGVLVSNDPTFISRLDQIVALAAHYRVPAMYPRREDAFAGGLASYGTDIADVFRLAGSFAGRILKGEKPADLPVQQVTKVGLYINMKTAKALGLPIPLTLLGRADEVVE